MSAGLKEFGDDLISFCVLLSDHLETEDIHTHVEGHKELAASSHKVAHIAASSSEHFS